jgi:hypothetical protein
MYSRVLLRYTIGSMAPGGEVAVQCRDCKTLVKLTTSNQHPDGVNTFVVAEAQTQLPASVPRSA